MDGPVRKPPAGVETDVRAPITRLSQECFVRFLVEESPIVGLLPSETGQSPS